MIESPLRRIYLFSDTYGRSKSPFDQDDADALISTDFRSFPLSKKKREFDIYGREKVTAHLIRLVFKLHAETAKTTHFSEEVKEEFSKTITGIFINAAPRTSKENGGPFYLATSGNIRIVTTDVKLLSSVKDKIETLSHLPNEDNNLYGPTEQFRSSYTPCLLDPHHKLTMVEDPIDTIPDIPEDWWELSYVDRFGNMMTFTKHPDRMWKEALEASKELGGFIKLIVGNVSQRVYISTSLRDAEPGALVMYPNGDLDIVRKWEEDEDRYTRLYQSAYFQFAKPDIGAKVRVR